MASEKQSFHPKMLIDNQVEEKEEVNFCQFEEGGWKLGLKFNREWKRGIKKERKGFNSLQICRLAWLVEDENSTHVSFFPQCSSMVAN